MTSTTGETSKLSSRFNKMMYALFVALACYYVFVKSEALEAMSMLGLALIFDPFDQSVEWKRRPTYQNVWLVAHVVCVFVLLAIVLLRKNL